jgi:hypothetical protein
MCNPSLAELEHVSVFKRVHAVTHVMRDLRLKLADKPLEHAHFGNGHESRLLQSSAVPGDRREAVIETGKAPVRPELALKVVSSHFASLCVVGQFSISTGPVSTKKQLLQL